ncbi:MAG: trehalose-phosphatase [Gemmatimonadota bacterium]
MIRDALDLVPRLRAARDHSGSLLLGLDFDGTLAPIVPWPGDAALPAALRPVLESLARRADTRVALISGRALRDLAERVGIDGVYYAGNHGLEIEGPGVHRVHPAAEAGRSRMATLAEQLRQVLAPLDPDSRTWVEDKGLTLSVHYRQVHDEAGAELVRSTVRDRTRAEPDLRVTDGRKVVEIRPDVDWHKGRALRFLRDTLEARHGAAPAVFIGDDRTDEDAFRELGGNDFAIVVGDPPPADTAAPAFLRGTGDVAEFLRRLAGPHA